MRKVIAAINMTIDGNCDHSVGLPDEEIHHHYENLLAEGDVILYGRKTFELMSFWQTLLDTPSKEKSMDDFAIAIDRIPKIVFSNTLSGVDWDTASLAEQSLKETVLELKQQEGKPIFVGSRSLINQLMKLNLIDEYQLCIHPVVAGAGFPLFNDVTDRTLLNLVRTKIFGNGAVLLCYVPA